VRMSDQPTCFEGQPRATAIGLGMAMTSGLKATCETVSGTSGAESPRRCCRKRTTHADDAGDQTSGASPSTFSSQPRASACSAAPDAIETTLTCTHWPGAAEQALAGG